MIACFMGVAVVLGVPECGRAHGPSPTFSFPEREGTWALLYFLVSGSGRAYGFPSKSMQARA